MQGFRPSLSNSVDKEGSKLYVFLFIVAILVINFIYNYWNYIQCEKYIRLFDKWLFDESFEGSLDEEKSQVVKLVKNAGCYDVLIPQTRATAYGQIVNANINPIEQFPNRISDIAATINKQILSAKG